MKLSSTLLQAMTIGIAVSTTSMTYQDKIVTTSNQKQKKTNVHKKVGSDTIKPKNTKKNCMACGMG